MKARRVTGLRITNKPCMLAIVCLLVLPSGLAQQIDEHYIVEPTPALRLGDEELTTVLLVNNGNRSEAHGRFLNVRPAVGLLTSTARTFIQEGVTTEYATQVLGTTLENGRLYAQLLKKSSRVLYDKENVISPSATSGGVVHTSIVGEAPHHHLFGQSKTLLQSHNDLVADKDWQDVDDRLILEKNSFVGNTDYVGSIPRASQVVFPIKSGSIKEKPIGDKQQVGSFNKILSSSRSSVSTDAFRIKANKVQPAVDLPTFTVKNMFSPSGFSWESSPLESENQHSVENPSQLTATEQRSPKLLYHQVMKDEQRPLSTVTYYGFADFTTIVGDSVIVFSPSTSSDKLPLGHVTSIKGEATLGRQDSSYVSNVAITITQDLIEPTFVAPMLSTDINELQVRPKDMRIRNEADIVDSQFSTSSGFEPTVEDEVTTVAQEQPPVEIFYDIQMQLKPPYDFIETPKEEKEEIDENTTQSPINEENIFTTIPPNEEEETFSGLEAPNENEDITLASSITDISSAAPTLTPEPAREETTSRIMLSRPSDEEILRIYSSLASVEAAQKASVMSEANLASVSVETTTEYIADTTSEENEPEKESQSTSTTTTTEEPIQPDIKIQGGATTIFFEDDPFLDFVSPSSTETVAVPHTQSNVVVESTLSTEQISKVSVESEVLDEKKTNPPVEVETESVTEIPVTDKFESEIEATTTLPESETEKEEEDEEDNEEEKEEHQNQPQEEPHDSQVYYKPIIKEIDENEQVEGCIRTSQVFLTQVAKTLTYYTTFFIPDEEDADETSTSIETNIVPSFDIAQATKHYCIQPTPIINVVESTEAPVLERPSKPQESNVIDSNIDNLASDDQLPEVTTPMMIVRENVEVTEVDGIDASGAGYEDEEDEDEDEEEDEDDQESGEDIELIYKTLYTTYTYLTTFFHDSTTSVSSRKEVVTNVITSTLGMDSISSTESSDTEPTSSVASGNDIASTVRVGIGRPTAKFFVKSSDLVKIDDILREDSDDIRPTDQLDDSKIAKTYYTTYTYYTTIFVDGETEVMSRTEVHTNVIGRATDNGISPSARNLNIDDTVFDEDNAVIDIRPTATYDTIQRTMLASNEIKKEATEDGNQSKYKTLSRGVQELESSSSSSSSRTEKKIVPIENDSVRMVTDVRSSSSNGDHQIIENGVLEDQISSESNTDEIIPSATLLLQTSFTTFTYYTTMYSSDTTNVISRLETMTNVVTETLQPTKTLNLEEATLPITYFTTFTYWTKLAKDGEITTLSREETVSNVVTPSVSEVSESSIQPTLASEQASTRPTNEPNESATPAQTDVTTLIGLEPTTYYTTYTYYTTSYAGDQTITDSRFETVTNVVFPSSVTSPISATILNDDAVTKKVDSELDILPFGDDLVNAIRPARTISYDYKTIVDAEGISTLYFTTEIVATTIDGTSTEIASSTSTINIDEVKKALSPTPVPEGSESTRTYKTGLVRLIEGTRLSNHTTTVYQSKVIGTIIEQRYAQIIESTSSFIIEKTQASTLNAVDEISATSTLSPTSVQPTAFIASTSGKPIESSISDAAEETEQDHEDEEGEEDSEEEDDGSGRPRTRLSFQTRKKTFTPVIRPFASRNRPQFAPKRKNILPSSATIITRSDFTPTITATPAVKSESRGRFSSSRKVNAGLSSSGASGSSSSGAKRFGRPTKLSQFGPSSSFPGSTRNRIQSSRIQSSASSFGGFPSSRRSGVPFRGSSTNIRSFSSAYAGNSRQRIRPSSSLPYDSTPNTAGYTTLPPDSDEEGVTQRYESEEETDVTTENLRRNNNPLLRFRRPQVNRPPFQPGQRNAPGNQVSARRNPLTQKPKTTTTTSTTTTTPRPRPRAFQRPTLGQIQNRSRPQSNLFPPRRLFPAQNINQAIDEEQKTGDDFPDHEDEENDSAEYENDGEGTEEDEQEDVNRRRRESFSKLLAKKRSKRQTDSIRSSFRNRFRRPSTAKPVAEERVEDPPEEEPSTVRSRATSRFTPRSHTLPTSTHSSSKPQPNSRAIRPTKPNSNNRAQFTLREKDTTQKIPPRPTSNFRRPMINGVSSRRTTTVASRPKAPRLKTYGNTVTESTHSSPRGRTPTSRTRSTARGRSRNDYTTDPVIPTFDGTITVTHTTPTEITIPVVNGKVTEYKNVLTTTSSTEVLVPNQYTSIIGQNGVSSLVLNREDTSINSNGATEITQFILHESPTTTVIFTPTTIRGRKTSFAHIIPSTIYQVENVISTMQAQIAANAPLANILLSQLLLGNIGLNQPNINPLLALGATQPISQNPGTPTTEFKTRSSTYVTTVTNAMSTVIPLTFHGKEILTTIFDSSSNVITATEYFTDTIIVTPTQQAQQVQQVNSLLLPLLLQQQLQGQQQAQPVLPIQNSIAPQLLLSDNLQDLDSNGIHKYNDYSQDIEDYPNNQDELAEASQNNHGTQKSGARKNGRKFNKQHTVAAPIFESSVITLYVSGRRPGEFSTVLSTVQIGSDSTLHKRQINRAQPVLKSDSADYEDFYRSDGSEIQEYLLPATNDITSSRSMNNNFLSEETQSLESIVGDVGLWYAKTSAQLEHLSRGGQSTTYDALQSSSSSTKLEASLNASDTNLESKYFLV